MTRGFPSSSRTGGDYEGDRAPPIRAPSKDVQSWCQPSVPRRGGATSVVLDRRLTVVYGGVWQVNRNGHRRW